MGFEGYVMGPDGYDGLKLTGDKSQYNKTYYTTHYSADDNTNTKVQDFIKSYKSKNNAEPNTFAALGYDTIYMIKQAIEKAGENATREDVRNAVAGMTFDGVTGKFTMVRLADQVRDRAGNEGRQAGVQHHRAAQVNSMNSHRIITMS